MGDGAVPGVGSEVPPEIVVTSWSQNAHYGPPHERRTLTPTNQKTALYQDWESPDVPGRHDHNRVRFLLHFL